MRIKLASVYVDDQEKALQFYTGVLGFVKKTDLMFGEARWLTVVSPDEPDCVELVLEPGNHPATRSYQKVLMDLGTPWTAFLVEDVQDEYERLRDLGVQFAMQPTTVGETIMAVFNDTCGNLIQIYQVSR